MIFAKSESYSKIPYDDYMINSPRYAFLYQINCRVWLTELSRKPGRTAMLDDIPDAEQQAAATKGGIAM